MANSFYDNWTRKVIGIATVVWGVFAAGVVLAQLVALALALSRGLPLALFLPLTEWGVLFGIPGGLGLLNKAGSTIDKVMTNKAPGQPNA